MLILAAGIGSNIGVFSLIDALLFRPLPVTRPEKLVRISSIDNQGRLSQLPSTILGPLARDTTLHGLCGFDSSYQGVEVNGTLSSIGVEALTGDCFQTLGISTQLGRAIAPDDDRPGTEGVAVITAPVWRSAFEGRPDILGKRVRMAGAAFTIVGVTEDRFTGLLLGFPAGILIPLRQEPAYVPGQPAPDYYWINVIGRRGPGVSERQLRASITAQTTSLLEQSIPIRYGPARRKLYLTRKLTVTPATTGIDYFMRDRFGEPLYAIFGICATLLTIACVNLSNLLQARGLRRRGEIIVRLALGARPIHIAGMLALESVLLVLAGAVLGIGFARWIVRVVLAHGADLFGNFSMTIGFDIRVVLFLIAAILSIAGAFAGASAWQAGRLCRPEGGRGIVRGNGPAKPLIVLQFALTLALVAGGSLFGSSLRRLDRIDLGVDTRNVWDVLLSARPGGYGNFAPGPYYRDLLRQIESLPGVSSATLSDDVPFLNAARSVPVAVVENGQPGQELQAQELLVADGFFKTIGIKIVAGDDFQRDGGKRQEPAVIVSESLAARLGNPRNLIGRHVRIGTNPAFQRLKIAGIASNAQLDLVNPARHDPPVIYVNLWQHVEQAAGYPVLLIKSSGGTLTAGPIREIVNAMGREYVERFHPLDAEKDGALVENRLLAYLAGAFGALALGTAAMGLFGLLSYQVAGRTSEIGIRMALGARRGQIQWLILRQIVSLLAAGGLIGVILSVATGRAVGGLLYGVDALDYRPITASLLILIATAANRGVVSGASSRVRGSRGRAAPRVRASSIAICAHCFLPSMPEKLFHTLSVVRRAAPSTVPHPFGIPARKCSSLRLCRFADRESESQYTARPVRFPDRQSQIPGRGPRESPPATPSASPAFPA